MSYFALGCGGVQWVAQERPDKPVDGISIPEPVAFTPEDDLSPAIAPNGRFLAFMTEQSGRLEVWVRDFATRSLYPLAPHVADDFDPAVSPDSQRLAFASRRVDAKGDIFIAEDFESGTDIRALTDEKTHDRYPVFAPDGQSLFFTSSTGTGPEYVHQVDLDSGHNQRVSPGPGFEPAPSGDGRYLVYTEPGRRGGLLHPHLVVLRLVDSATTALTLSAGPEGFASFMPRVAADGGVPYTIAYVRFPDDDNEDGVLDGNDRGSLWRLDVDLDGLFLGQKPSAPVPLTDGSEDELFPRFGGGFLYFAQGRVQQDVARLPMHGMFPAYKEPEDYLKLARIQDEPRRRWFVYRTLVARTPPSALLHAQAYLRIANIHLEWGRLKDARIAFERLRACTQGASVDTPRAELRGIAEAELVSLDRRAKTGAPSGTLKRASWVEDMRTDLLGISTNYAWSTRVRARVALEVAELKFDAGSRVEAIEAFDRVAQDYPEASFSASKAALRKIELLEITHDPHALGEAYARVLARFPDRHEVVTQAARRVIEVHLEALPKSATWRDRVDVLRRLQPQGGNSLVGVEARWKLVSIFTANGASEDAALELRRLVKEAPDRVGKANALRRLAKIDEDLGELENARLAWTQLRQEFKDLPGFFAEARDAITRTSLAHARQEEKDGNIALARQSYKRVVDNESTQVNAYRRYLALSAELGKIDEVLQDAERKKDASPGSPIARYAFGLALTWAKPPRLDDALDEVNHAIRINPQFTQAYIVRGWIREMQELQKPGRLRSFLDAAIQRVGAILGVKTVGNVFLESAITDYRTALRLNPEASDPETEAEITLNLGNAHYRLAVVSNDILNMGLALRNYLSCWKLGLGRLSEISELVFWERLGRAASWSEAWEVSTWATREAIRLAKKYEKTTRLPELYGTLALAYKQAGEDSYAQSALEAYGARLAFQKESQRLVIAKREEARAEFHAEKAWDPRALEGILARLKEGRTFIRKHVVQRSGRVWRPVDANVTRAPFGFSELNELNINLALSSEVHAALGEISRSVSIDERRRALSTQIMADVPTKLMVDAEPLTLNNLRERFGLYGTLAWQRVRAGDWPGADDLLREIEQNLEGWSTSDDFSWDRRALTMDRAQCAAIRAEVLVYARARGQGLGVNLQPYEDAIHKARTAMNDAFLAADAESSTVAYDRLSMPVLSALPSALSSTVAIATTASVAAYGPRLTGAHQRGRAVDARLHYATGLLLLDRAFRPTQSPQRASGFQAYLEQLDGSVVALGRARTAFERAAKRAVSAGSGLGASILAQGLYAVLELTRILRDRSNAVNNALSQLARRIAVSSGHIGMALSFEIRDVLGQPHNATALTAVTERVGEIPPQLLRNHRGIVKRLYAQTASSALSLGDLHGAFQALDRSMLFSVASGPIVQVDNPLQSTDVRLSARMRRRLKAFREARRLLFAADGATERDEFERLKADVARSHKRFVATNRLRQSELASARLFGVPYEAEDLPSELEADEAILALGEVGGHLHLFWVDGSTVSETAFVHHASEMSVQDVQALLKGVRAAMLRGEAPPVKSVAALRKVLWSPFLSRMGPKMRVLVAGRVLKQTLPQAVAPHDGIQLAHVSAPSVWPLLKERQQVGALGCVLLGTDPSTVPDCKVVLGDRTLLQFRGPRAGGTSDDPRVSERSLVEALRDVPQDLVVVDLELRVEPEAVERSVLRLPGKKEPDDSALQTSMADAFDREIALQDLHLPARTLILSGVSEAEAHKLVPADLALIPRGSVSIIVMPREIPRPGLLAFVKAFQSRFQELSPAQAFQYAIREAQKTHPQVGLAAFLGHPGLDDRGRQAYARSIAPRLRRRPSMAIRKRNYPLLVFELERLVRVQTVANMTKGIEDAYSALASTYLSRLKPANPGRAADAQRRLIDYQRKAGRGPAVIANSEVGLATIYSKAKDDKVAERIFLEAIKGLENMGETKSVALGLWALGRHYEEKLEFEEAAKTFESAVNAFTESGVYSAQKRPPAAMLVLDRLGAIYLNSLSDPGRAEAAYLRFKTHARSEAKKVSATLSLARVARRRGDFEAALARAEEAELAARAENLRILELESLVEAANVAWYQGDYSHGQGLCDKSLAVVNDNMRAFRLRLTQEKRLEKRDATRKQIRSLKKSRIYALSVCGLMAMSVRDFKEAVRYLERAQRLARELGDQSEVATQYNNLGRVYLEFGEMGTAIDAFRAAYEIDQSLKDRYAMAYDLRNLGEALVLEGDLARAEETLTKGLEYALEVRDLNNELRARFALASLAEKRGHFDSAHGRYTELIPLANRLDIKEIAWKAHRSLGLILQKRGKLDAAEAELREATRIAGMITGRSGTVGTGLYRYAAFDDLMMLFLDTGRKREALEIANRIQALERVALLDDTRIPFASPRVPELIRAIKRKGGDGQKNRGKVSSEEAELARLEPQVFSIFEALDLKQLEALAPDDAIVFYRLTGNALVAFVLDKGGIHVRRHPISSAAMRALVADYTRRLASRSDLHEVHERLEEVLVTPIMPLLEGKRRLALVQHGVLRYLAFAALRVPDTKTRSPEALFTRARMIDRFELVQALDTAAAFRALKKRFGLIVGSSIVAFGAASQAPMAVTRPLPFAQKELQLIKEEFPRATTVSGPAVTKQSLLAGLAGSRGVFHFSGHTFLAGAVSSGSGARDPLGTELVASDGSVKILDVLGKRSHADLVVLSACWSMVSSAQNPSKDALSGQEILSFAQALQVAGVSRVLASTTHVHDLAASLIMKHFYRASKRLPVAAALREAQRRVRRYYPHPAWWATFSLLKGGPSAGAR